jgi:nucleoside-diphosphate-sugar epimerase
MNPRVTVLGARGLVGSAFVRHLRGLRMDVREISREDYDRSAGSHSDVVIDAAANSRKYLADDRPEEDFELSVRHRLRTLLDYPADLQVHISSVDVYPDLSRQESTGEDRVFEISRSSNYGFHKALAEELVRHYAKSWLTVRLGGLVGPGLRKNPVYDILMQKPLRIHPESRYQFIHTDDMARIVWTLVERGLRQQVFNVCGQGLVSPREIAERLGRDLDLGALPPDAAPRIVDVNVDKVRGVVALPTSDSALAYFFAGMTESP